LSAPYLSIVIPAHNEEERLPTTLERIDAFLALQSYTSEIVVVENASRDRTLDIAQAYQARMPNLRVMHDELPGKGRAVRAGMLAAKGTFRFICDADLSMPIEEVNHFLPPNLPDPQCAIASREAKGAKRHGEPPYRHFVGRGFNTLVRLLALPVLQDTQCGFKLFRGDIADEIFPLQTINGWTFDVEVLFIARQRGYRIVEVPINWYYDSHSKIRVLNDSLHMFLDLLLIRRNNWQGRYR
jgi:dolichyl-phosphate beta-glucosyltransferase